MSDNYIKNVVEAAMLAAGRPLQLNELAQLFDENARPDHEGLRAALTALDADYGSRGIEVKETGSGFRIQVRKEMANEVSRLWPERPPKYSRALLETLALIAYRQPITRAEIEAVRGVAVNPNIIKTVIERNWVRVVGTRDVPGRPELLGTTKDFLDYFGLRTLEDLPPLAELKAMGEINLQLDLAKPAEPGSEGGSSGEGGASGAGGDASGSPGDSSVAAASAEAGAVAAVAATGDADAAVAEPVADATVADAEADADTAATAVAADADAEADTAAAAVAADAEAGADATSVAADTEAGADATSAAADADVSVAHGDEGGAVASGAGEPVTAEEAALVDVVADAGEGAPAAEAATHLDVSAHDADESGEAVASASVASTAGDASEAHASAATDVSIDDAIAETAATPDDAAAERTAGDSSQGEELVAYEHDPHAATITHVDIESDPGDVTVEVAALQVEQQRQADERAQQEKDVAIETGEFEMSELGLAKDEPVVETEFEVDDVSGTQSDDDESEAADAEAADDEEELNAGPQSSTELVAAPRDRDD